MRATITQVWHTRCPSETVFDLMADIRNELQWNSAISRVDLTTGEPIGKGTKFFVEDKRGHHVSTIVAFDRPRTLSFVMNDGKLDVDIDATLIESDGVTSVTSRFSARARGLTGLLLPLLAPPIRREMTRSGRDFVKFCEAQG